jgi:hypothetical protein
MYVLKLTGTDKTTAQMIFFAVLLVLYIVFWVVGRFLRKQHDLKNDF